MYCNDPIALIGVAPGQAWPCLHLAAALGRGWAWLSQRALVLESDKPAYIPPLALSRGVILIFLLNALDLLCMWCPSNAVWDSVEKNWLWGSDREQMFTCICIFLLVLCSNEWHNICYLSPHHPFYIQHQNSSYDPQCSLLHVTITLQMGLANTPRISFSVWLLSLWDRNPAVRSLSSGLELCRLWLPLDLVQIGLCGITKGAVKTCVLVITAKGI